jgi:hypothetical protein
MTEIVEPKWGDAPEWAQWWAVDKNGDANWFEHEPHTVGDFWIQYGGNWQYCWSRGHTPGWKGTLRKRLEERGR